MYSFSNLPDFPNIHEISTCRSMYTIFLARAMPCIPSYFHYLISGKTKYPPNYHDNFFQYFHNTCITKFLSSQSSTSTKGSP